jgi:hypothetical protein
VDLRDVRVVERRQRLRLAREPGQSLRIARKDLRQHFQRDVAIEPGVAGAVDLAHSAGADRSQHFVGTEPGPRRERHGGEYTGLPADAERGQP